MSGVKSQGKSMADGNMGMFIRGRKGSRTSLSHSYDVFLGDLFLRRFVNIEPSRHTQVGHKLADIY